MEGNKDENIKQKKKEDKKNSRKEEKLRRKRAKIVFKLDKIESSIDEVIQLIEKDSIDIEVEQKEKIGTISNDLKQVKGNIEKVEENVENAQQLVKKGFNIFGITIWQIFAYFILYSIFGFLVETTFAFFAEGVIESRQSFLYGPFCAIYGLGAAVMIVGLQKFKKNNFTLFIGGVILGAITEYLVSLIGEIVFNVKWWDYSNMPFNIQGRICATYSVAWGALGVFLVRYINPKVDKWINRAPLKSLKVTTSIIMVFLLFDWLISSFALQMFYVRLADTHHIEIQSEEQYMEFGRKMYENETIKNIVNTLWSDTVMVKTFPNLRVTTKNGAVIYVSNLYQNIEPYYLKVFEPVLFDFREEKMTHKN